MLTSCIGEVGKPSLINQRQFSSSANGGMSLSGRATDTGMSVYRYDAFNRLTNYNSGSAEASYTYNANNLRAGKTVNRQKTAFVWNGQNLAAENKTGEVNTYTYDPTGVHIANQNGNITSYLKDYHGNIIGTTTAAGVMVQEANNRMDYDAYGNQWIGDTPDPFGYCGEYYDYESGLIYLRNRYYDTVTGRFLTEDSHWNVDNMIYGEKSLGNDPAYANAEDKFDIECNLYDDIKTRNFFSGSHEKTHYNIFRNPNNVEYNSIHYKSNRMSNKSLYGLNIYNLADDAYNIFEQKYISCFSGMQHIPDENAISQSNNLYVYVMNNPVNYVDAIGNFAAAAAAAATAPEWVPYVAAGAVTIIGAGITYYKEHTSNKRKSTLNKHQNGQARKKKDAGGEKGDARRKSRNNKRRP